MNFHSFRRFLLHDNNFGVFFIRNRSLKIDPTLFDTILIAYSGKYRFTRSIFFLHNNINASNLFLTKKIKPKPIIKKVIKKKK